VKSKVVLNVKLSALQQNATPNASLQNPVATLSAKKPNATGNVENQPLARNQNAIFSAKDLLVNQELLNLLLFVAPAIKPMRALRLLRHLALQLMKHYFHLSWRLSTALKKKLVKVRNHVVLVVPALTKKILLRQINKLFFFNNKM